MKLTDRDRRAMTVGGICLVALLIVRFAVMPWVDQWSAARDRAASLRVELSKLNDQSNDLQMLSRMLDKAYGEAPGKPLEDVENTQIAFNKSVQEMLKAGGIGFQSIKEQNPRPIKKIPNTWWVSVEVDGKGKVDQLAKCLAAIRKTEQLIVVDRITAKNDQKKPGNLSLKLVLGTLAYEEGRRR